MTAFPPFEIFLVAAPGFEKALLAEVREKGFQSPKLLHGGVTVQGTWPEVWRANLVLRGASRVLARLGEFRVSHLAQLDKLARKFPWGQTLRRGTAVRVEVTCKKSRIYHAGAAAQRFEAALREDHRMIISPEAEICIKARIDHNLCTISIDTSGDMLHKRGHKEAIGKAPMRETFAALFLRACGFDGNEPVVDPMCGSGTFVIEAAEIAMSLQPGRSRNFAFEHLASFDAQAWSTLCESHHAKPTALRFHGSDRDAGAIRNSIANAARAGVDGVTAFKHHAISDLEPPLGPPGLVIVNPPYGTRIGDKRPLFDLYAAMGHTLRSRFKGWRVGIITTDQALAKATGLPFLPPGPPMSHGGLKVFLFQTAPLA